VSTREFKLEELAKAAGVSARTVRYYVQRGLLPAPVFRAKDTAYDDSHLVRLRAIRKLQDAHLPLEAIATELARRSLAELATLADKGLVPGRTRAPRTNAGETVTRFALAPGVELLISSDASDEARALAEEILRVANYKGEGR
jgi:DNA-binding transcriptional MerR regulator